jgi:hypothetical protein
MELDRILRRKAAPGITDSTHLTRAVPRSWKRAHKTVQGGDAVGAQAKIMLMVNEEQTKIEDEEAARRLSVSGAPSFRGLRRRNPFIAGELGLFTPGGDAETGSYKQLQGHIHNPFEEEEEHGHHGGEHGGHGEHGEHEEHGHEGPHDPEPEMRKEGYISLHESLFWFNTPHFPLNTLRAAMLFEAIYLGLCMLYAPTWKHAWEYPVAFIPAFCVLFVLQPYMLPVFVVATSTGFFARPDVVREVWKAQLNSDSELFFVSMQQRLDLYRIQAAEVVANADKPSADGHADHDSDEESEEEEHHNQKHGKHGHGDDSDSDNEHFGGKSSFVMHATIAAPPTHHHDDHDHNV